MATRIDLELTSKRDDGTWTWRAAGARQPKGDLDGALLPGGAKVGDVLRAEIEKGIDGIAVLAVMAPKEAKSGPERLELIGSKGSEPLVTTQLAPKGRRPGGRGDGDRRDRGPRDDRGRGRRDDKSGPRGGERRGGRDTRDARESRGPRGRDTGDRPGRDDREQREPERPRPKRLKAGRQHRKAVLASLPAEQQPIAEVVMSSGIPGLRQVIDKQNELARADGKPLVDAGPLLSFGEQLLGPLRVAEWHDRADAALRTIDTVDVRDLRSVVVAADTAARNDETRALALQLREGLVARVDREHATWLAELAELVAEGRVVRALRVSSRPPKAGAPLPPDLAERLAASTAEGLTAEISSARWITVLEAVALSPVRTHVVPASVPEKPTDELLAAVRKEAARLPQIAERFGITAAPPRPPGKPAALPIPPPPDQPAEQPAEPPADQSSAASAPGTVSTTSPD